MATTAERLAELMAENGHDQADVAAAVGSTQGAISLIIVGKTRRSRLLPEIADYYGVSLRWLRGEDVERGGRQLPREPLTILLPVTLPSEPALARMFLGLLDGIDPAISRDEQAQLLAQRLPIGLAQLRDVLPAGQGRPARAAASAPADSRATPDPVTPR